MKKDDVDKNDKRKWKKFRPHLNVHFLLVFSAGALIALSAPEMLHDPFHSPFVWFEALHLLGWILVEWSQVFY